MAQYAQNFISNAPEASRLDLETARAVMDKYGGLAKSSRYYVRILPSGPTDAGATNFLAQYSNNVEEFSYLCDSAELPGRGFMTTDLRYYATNFKSVYQSTYEDINLTFICRNNFEERKFFDDWMSHINPPSTYDFAYRDDYECNLEIYQLSDLAPESDNGSSAIYFFRFDHAYPVLVNPQPVTWADDNFHRLTVTFTYQRWYRPGIDRPDATGFSLIQGANINNVDGGPQLYNTEFRNPDPARGR